MASSLLSPNVAKITRLIMEENFWEGGEKVYTRNNRQPEPDFGTVNKASLTAALPFFFALKTLELAVACKEIDSQRRDTEANLTTFFSSLPNLEHLVLYSSLYQLLQLRKPFLGMTTTCLRSLRMESCVFNLTDINHLLNMQSAILKVVSLRNIGLLGGHFIDLFTAFRNDTFLTEISVEGWLVEFENDDTLYFSDSQKSEGHNFPDPNVARRKLARREIEAFVRRERNHFPSELCSLGSSILKGFVGSRWSELIVVLEDSSVEDPQEDDD